MGAPWARCAAATAEALPAGAHPRVYLWLRRCFTLPDLAAISVLSRSCYELCEPILDEHEPERESLNPTAHRRCKMTDQEEVSNALAKLDPNLATVLSSLCASNAGITKRVDEIESSQERMRVSLQGQIDKA